MISFQATKDSHFKKVLCDIIDYVSRDLRHSEGGGFYSAEDADSLPTTHHSNHKKEEGAFCVWTDKELEDILQGIHFISICTIFYVI